jgi:hypothetical protein
MTNTPTTRLLAIMVGATSLTACQPSDDYNARIMEDAAHYLLTYSTPYDAPENRA